MQLDLKNYSADAVLESYKFILKQYLGGLLAGMDACLSYPTTYIFKEVCIEIRNQYIQKNNVEIEIQLVEKKIASQLHSLSGKPLTIITQFIDELIKQSKQ